MTVESGAAVAESYLRVDVDMKFMHLLPARKVFMYALINIYVYIPQRVCADSQQIYASNITNKIFAHELQKLSRRATLK